MVCNFMFVPSPKKDSVSSSSASSLLAFWDEVSWLLRAPPPPLPLAPTGEEQSADKKVECLSII